MGVFRQKIDKKDHRICHITLKLKKNRTNKARF